MLYMRVQIGEFLNLVQLNILITFYMLRAFLR